MLSFESTRVFPDKYHSLESPENYKNLEDYKSLEVHKSQEVCHVSRNQNLKSLEDWQSIRRGENWREREHRVSKNMLKLQGRLQQPP